MNISNIKAITHKELYSYFASPVAYVFLIMFLVLTGFFTFFISPFFDINEASLAEFFRWHPWLYLVLVPAVGMRVWSEERRSGSLELLFTLPTTTTQAVIGKFIAGCSFLGLALALTFPLWFTVAYLGDPDNGVIFCGYIGSFFIAAVFLAVSTFTSALTRNQVNAFIISVVVCLLLILAGWRPVTSMFSNWAPEWVVDTVAAFSIITHYESLQRGVVDLRDIFYCLSAVGLCLFGTGVVLKNHRL
jgi:ABC-2 type transport system permease protein